MLRVEAPGGPESSSESADLLLQAAESTSNKGQQDRTRCEVLQTGLEGATKGDFEWWFFMVILVR
jgi:hypothetical protein